MVAVHLCLTLTKQADLSINRTQTFLTSIYVGQWNLSLFFMKFDGTIRSHHELLLGLPDLKELTESDLWFGFLAFLCPRVTLCLRAGISFKMECHSLVQGHGLSVECQGHTP